MNQKRIVCFGDSNTWGYSAEANGRFEDDERWTRILARELGDDFHVVEEGLGGRTTVFPDPLNEGLRGMDYLYPCLLSHAPFSAVLIMLGTNDCKERFSASPQNITDGLGRLVRCAQAAPVWRDETRILLVAPIIIAEPCYRSAVTGEMGKGCVEKSRELPRLFEQYAVQNGCAYFDCNTVCCPNDIDYMHLNLESHRSLGTALAGKLCEIIG